MHVFVGWDPREATAADVCKHSILKYSPDSIVTFLRQSSLREAGLYKRKWHYEGNQFVDDIDGKPFSTQFSFSRFLTPILAKKMGITEGWVLFIDCDFLATTNVDNLLNELDNSKALACVKHDFQPPTQKKMDNMAQESYPRKNWSSFMAFNMSHPSTQKLTLEMVNTWKGSDLHAFKWLEDDEIQGVNEDWNYLAASTERARPDYVPNGFIHYTWGMPFMKGYEYCELSDYWFSYFGRMHLASA